MNTQTYDQPVEAVNIPYKEKYFRFLNESCPKSQIEAKNFIQFQLDKVVSSNDDIPANYDDLKVLITNNAEQVGKQYQQYLIDRKNGKPRQLFKNKSHALNFIKLVAPTKMVDGSWLYGFTQRYDDERFSKLIRIYLDELGSGDVHTNHVVLFRQLLNKYDLEEFDYLADELFLQGAIQLALGRNTETFTPEIIGFNLAYEQLPLHLMITAYELKELNIDPYYFTLHITVDNALTGHSKMAIEAFRDSRPSIGSQQDYFSRVIKGMALNKDGLSTISIINSYNIDAEIVDIFKRKSTLGKYMHSHQCSIGGKAINTWLENPQNIPEFLQSLEKNHWIIRNENPNNSRFWRLIEGNKSLMYGVFSQYEKQVIYDWIAGTALESLPKIERLGKSINVINTSPEKHIVPNQDGNKLNSPPSNVIKMALNKNSLYAESNSLHSTSFAVSRALSMTEEEIFNGELAKIKNRDELMQFLIGWMSPSKHHIHLGLLSTKLYIDLINCYAYPTS